MFRGYKIRIYPTQYQENNMFQHAGACRFIWNHMLSKQEELFKNGERHLSGFDMIRNITILKRNPDFCWLSNVANSSLQIICRDLDKAYQSFYKKKSSLPKYKSKKKCKISFPVHVRGFYFKNENVVHIEKIGDVKFKSDFKFSYGRTVQKYLCIRISYENHKWFASFTLECENQTPILTRSSMGIDLGVKDLAIVEFNGEKIVFHNINKSEKMRKLNKKLKHIQRNISRKYEFNKQGNTFISTNNIEKEKQKLQRVYSKIVNIRRNYIHQTTHRLVSMLPQRVVMENLNIAGMMKNHNLAKAIQEQCLHEFVRQMQYKCEWNKIEFIQADRFFPSSKLCSNCGCIKDNLRLRDRTYVCEHCGNVVDRDYNAAINLSRYIA